MQMAKKKRKKLSPAQASAAERLKRVWQEAKIQDDTLTQQKVAELMGWSGQSAFSQYVNGVIPINVKALLGLSNLFKVDPMDIYPELALAFKVIGPSSAEKHLERPVRVWKDRSEVDDGQHVFVPMLSIELAAGDGLDIDEYVKCTMPFSAHTLQRKGVPEDSAYMVEVAGDSMEPRLFNGDHVVVNTADKTLREGSVYAIRDSSMLRVKLLIPRPGGGVIIRSYNSASYPDEELTAEEAEERIDILGRVFHSESMHWQ